MSWLEKITAEKFQFKFCLPNVKSENVHSEFHFTFNKLFSFL